MYVVFQKMLKTPSEHSFKRNGYDNSFNSWIDKNKCHYIKGDIFQNYIPAVKTK